MLDFSEDWEYSKKFRARASCPVQNLYSLGDFYGDSAMKHLLGILAVSISVVFCCSCASHDPYVEQSHQRHKQMHAEDVQRALDGELTLEEFESSMNKYDAATLNERAKKGEGLEELEAKLADETKEIVQGMKGLK